MCHKCFPQIIDQVPYHVQTILAMVANWIILMISLALVKSSEAKAEQENKLSSGVFLFKNIVNYIVYLVLLS